MLSYETMLNYVHRFIKTRIVSHTLISGWNEAGDLNFYLISETSKSVSVRSKSFKKIYRVENFRANVLKEKITIIWANQGNVAVVFCSTTSRKI